MEYLKIKNWSKFQHYKLRNPPWIKLHRTLMADYLFTQLSDTDKCHLILIWLEGSNNDGAVPNDPDFLRRRLGTKRNPDLNLFIKQGWLLESASINSLHQTETEKRREEKNREAKSKPVYKTDEAKQKRIAQYLVSGDIEGARKLKDQA